MSDELKAIKELQDQVEKSLKEKANKATVEQIEQALSDIKAILAKMEEESEEEEKEEEEYQEEEEKHKKSVADFMKKSEKQLTELQEELRIQKDRGNRGGVRKSIGTLASEKLKEAGLSSGMKKGQRVNIDVDFDIVNKAAGTMETGNVIPVGTNAIPFTLSDAEAGLTRVVRRQPWIMQLANVSSTDKMYVQWAEQANPDGGALATTEGSDKSLADFDWVEKSKKVEKVTAFIKVSREALDDISGLENEINTELAELIMLEVDEALLSGNGTTPNLSGILAQDTAYSAGSFAATVTSPTKSDVLRTAIAQVVAAQFVPNAILLHPDDVASMDLEKSPDDSHYLLPPFKSADGLSISGVPVYANTGQTVDNFTVGDFTKLNVKVRKSFGIDVGYENDDFTKNLVTILGEMRLVSYIKTNHAPAFVSGDFSAAITALAAS